MSFDATVMLLMGVGLCLIATGVFMWIGSKLIASTKDAQSRCSVEVTARVVGYIERRGDNMHHITKTYWKPIFSFPANGDTQRVVSEVAYRPKPFYLDAFVHIRYNPNNPKDILLPQAKWDILVGDLFCVFSLLCFLLCLFLLIYLYLNS